MSCALYWVLGEVLDVDYIEYVVVAFCSTRTLGRSIVLFRHYVENGSSRSSFPWLGWGGGVASAPYFRTRMLLQVKFTYFIP
jgi:hypothetical protein